MIKTQTLTIRRSETNPHLIWLETPISQNETGEILVREADFLSAIIDWLSEKGYEIKEMIPEVLPCPSPTCEGHKDPSSMIARADYEAGWFECKYCGYSSPHDYKGEDAIKAHNAIAEGMRELESWRRGE